MSIESFVMILLTIAVVGFLVHLIVTYVAMAQPFKDVIIAVTVVGLVLWLLAIWTGRASVPSFRVFS
jgi:hypothetical protein